MCKEEEDEREEEEKVLRNNFRATLHEQTRTLPAPLSPFVHPIMSSADNSGGRGKKCQKERWSSLLSSTSSANYMQHFFFLLWQTFLHCCRNAVNRIARPSRLV